MQSIELVQLSNGEHVSVYAGQRGDHEVARALVVSLHYGGPVSPGYGGGLLEQVVVPGLQETGAVMVAPDCGGEAWSDAPCVGAIERAVDYAHSQYRIDANRMVLVGYSKGGIGTWALANTHELAFSAAIVMAGRPPVPLDAAAWHVPLYVIQAGADELFPVSLTRDAVASLDQHGANVALTVLDGVTHFETYRFAEPLREAVPWLHRVWHR